MAYHSLTFGTGTKAVNTWDDWHLVPDRRPVINPPGVKTNYVDIPGMDGSLDYSEALGSLKYINREGSWTFYVMNDYGDKNYKFKSWDELYRSIIDSIHGLRLQVWSEDDPDYVYFGRLTLDEWNPEKDYSQVTISYNLEPYKKKASSANNSDTSEYDWKWNELYKNKILYGKFDVNERKVRNLINDKNESFEIAITVTSDMTVSFSNKTFKLKSGKNRNSGIILNPGNNIMTFEGNGQVIINYDKDGVVL